MAKPMRLDIYPSEVLLRRLELWRSRQKVIPTRAEAIRMLVERSLALDGISDDKGNATDQILTTDDEPYKAALAELLIALPPLPYKAALVELLIALPPLPDSWPAGAVQTALAKALTTYEEAKTRV